MKRLNHPSRASVISSVNAQVRHERELVPAVPEIMHGVGVAQRVGTAPNATDLRLRRQALEQFLYPVASERFPCCAPPVRREQSIVRVGFEI